jgi:hypothetical protein
MTKDFGGIQSLFEDAIVPVHGGTDATDVDTRGGLPVRDGVKQTSAGDTGQHVTTVDLPGSSMSPTAAGKTIRGS